MSHQTVVTEKSADLPLTLSEAKSHLRLLHDDLDVEVEEALKAAVEYCETVAGRALRVSHTLTQKYCQWPCGPVRFDRQPVTAISSVTYYDGNGDSQTLASSNYRLQASTLAAGYLEWDDDFTRPTLDTRDDAVTITFTVGYTDIASVPAMAKHAIKLKLAEIFGDLRDRERDATVKSCDSLLAAIDWGSYR
jgi:uncharacterized phiE125 gp8 family phage protein